jgi:hypothetical protein
MNNLFTPKAAGTVNIAATTSSAAVALVRTGSSQVRVKNIDTTNVAFINFGASTVTAVATTGIPIGPGETCGFTLPAEFTHAAAITAASTATVYFTPGNGL